MMYAGLLASVALLMWLALRGVNIIIASLLCSLIVILTNQLDIAESLTRHYAAGPLGAFTFAGNYFFLFAAGAAFGRVMGESHAASSIALAMVRALGGHRALWIITLACALLTYGGVAVFVVIFAVYPLGLKLLQEANIPKRLFTAALTLGAGTFTLSALPGTPSVQNVISANGLGTDLYAGFWHGLIGGALMFALGIWYLERQRLKAEANGESFVASPNDTISTIEDSEYPSWVKSLIPMLTVLLVILLPRLITLSVGKDTVAISEGAFYDLTRFANSQRVLWPSMALAIGTLIACCLFDQLRKKALSVVGNGAQDAVHPLINTSVVIGYAGVVTQTQGFATFSTLLLDSGLPPLISMFTSVSVVSAITGSASGGLQIFMQSMAPAYLAMGIDAGVLHRLATMASGCFDSLPHCGVIIAILTITGQTHKGAYKDMAVITIAIPLMATALLIAVEMLR